MKTKCFSKHSSLKWDYLFPFSGKGLLGIPVAEEVAAVLEEDGTEISDEDYFAFIRHNTTIMLLRQGQKWLPVGTGS